MAVVAAGLLFGAGLVLIQSHAAARANRLTYAHLANIQKRIISETLASAIGPRSKGLKPRLSLLSDQGSGGDGAPVHPPASFGSPGGTGSPTNYFPTQPGQCSQTFGQDVKVNQNCLNLQRPDTSGPLQANNEPSIAVDPFNSKHLVASDNNYIRGDGTCGSHFSLDGGRTGRTRPCRTGSPWAAGLRASVLAGRRRHIGGVGHAWKRLRELPALQPRHGHLAESRSVERVRGVPGHPEQRGVVELPGALHDGVLRPDRGDRGPYSRTRP